MRKLFLLPLMLLLVSCESEEPNGGGATSIVGSWKFDKLANTINVADEQTRLLISVAINDEADFNGTSITFADNGAFTELFIGYAGATGSYTVSNDGFLTMHYNDEANSEDPVQYGVSGKTLVLTFNHTERYKAKYPSAGVVSVIERRYYILK